MVCPGQGPLSVLKDKGILFVLHVGLFLLAGLCGRVPGTMCQSSPDIYNVPHFSRSTFSLYHELACQSNDSIIFSPVSIR